MHVCMHTAGEAYIHVGIHRVVRIQITNPLDLDLEEMCCSDASDIETETLIQDVCL